MILSIHTRTTRDKGVIYYDADKTSRSATTTMVSRRRRGGRSVCDDGVCDDDGITLKLWDIITSRQCWNEAQSFIESLQRSHILRGTVVSSIFPIWTWRDQKSLTQEILPPLVASRQTSIYRRKRSVVVRHRRFVKFSACRPSAYVWSRSVYQWCSAFICLFCFD